MANFDKPNGFRCITPDAQARTYTASATIAEGDFLAIASGKVLPFATGSHASVIGLAGAAAANGETLPVFDDPTYEFVGQCSGTYAATLDGTAVDLEGTTGIMEVNENSASNPVIRIKRHYSQPGATEVGANSRVVVTVARHVLAPDNGSLADRLDTIDNTGSGYSVIAALTDSSGGTSDGTVEAVGATNSGDVSGAINNNFKELATWVNGILAHLKSAGIIASS